MSQGSEDRLDSWKEIAAYLGRDIRTVRRWEENRGLPVHRVPGGGRPSVFAFRTEIQAWLRDAEAHEDLTESRHRGQADAGDSAAEESSHVGPDAGSALINGAVPALGAGLPEGNTVEPPLIPAGDGLQRPARQRLLVAVAGVVIAGAIGVFLSWHFYHLGSLGRSLFSFTQSPVDAEKVPVIFSVTPIVPQARQRILIQGQGFGLHVPYARTDSAYLSVRDTTKRWAAGRMIPWNWDEVMLDVESWSDTQIVLNGFSGSYGSNGWDLSFADEVEIAVWNPQSGAGPGLYHAMVVSTQARR